MGVVSTTSVDGDPLASPVQSDQVEVGIVNRDLDSRFGFDDVQDIWSGTGLPSLPKRSTD